MEKTKVILHFDGEIDDDFIASLEALLTLHPSYHFHEVKRGK